MEYTVKQGEKKHFPCNLMGGAGCIQAFVSVRRLPTDQYREYTVNCLSVSEFSVYLCLKCSWL